MVCTCGRTEGPFRKMLEKARLLTRLLSDFFSILLGVRAHQHVHERMSGGCNGLAWRGQAWDAVHTTSDSGDTWVRLVAGGRLRVQG